MSDQMSYNCFMISFAKSIDFQFYPYAGY